jgi:hypothetical protein
LQPKLACFAIQRLTRELAGYCIDRRCDTGGTNNFVLTLTNLAGESKLAAWAMSEPRDVRRGPKLKLELGAMTQYISPFH